MGNECCNAKISPTEEIENCKTMIDLINYVINLSEEAEIEQNELKKYLEDNKNEPKTVDISGFTNEDLNKRISYLDELKKTLQKINILLKDHPKTDLGEVKKWLIDFYQIYSWVYDEDQRHIYWYNAFESYITANSTVVLQTGEIDDKN